MRYPETAICSIQRGADQCQKLMFSFYNYHLASEVPGPDLGTNDKRGYHGNPVLTLRKFTG